jgi:hypothetical protein
MFKASAQVLDQCMVNHGFTGYKTFVPRHLNRNQYSDAIPDLGVLHSQPSDTAYGLQAQLKATKEAPGPKFPLDDPYLQSLSESELSRMTTVMRGTKIITVRSATGGFVNVRADGCAHEADSAVYPQGWEELDVMRDGLLGSAMANTYADPTFAKSLSSWKKCMALHGIQAERPGLFRSSLEQEYQARPSDAEKILKIEQSSALADFECQSETRYNKIAVHTLVREMGKMISDHATELDELRRIELQAVKNSKKILGTSK